MKWNPADYAQSSDAQLKWAQELQANLNLSAYQSILDVGCGDGKISANFARLVPDGRVVAIDSSPEMIEYAITTYPASQYPNLSFACVGAQHLTFEQEFDLIFSNAALHWVDDHPAFLAGARQALRPGGRLIISCGGAGNAIGENLRLGFALPGYLLPAKFQWVNNCNLSMNLSIAIWLSFPLMIKAVHM